MKRNTKMIIIAAVVVLLCILTGIIFPPSLGKMKPFKDANGQIISNSIAEKSTVNIQGEELGIYLLGEDIAKPVLLVCGGGPGIPQYFLEYEMKSDLAKHFVVCYFDYRGTGRSFPSALGAEDMTTERYLQDVLEITSYLRERFGQEKIYIMGHSFGTYIALRSVCENPELYHAYFAMSQITNQRESEAQAFDYMKAEYEKAQNASMVKKFNQYHITESAEDYDNYFKSGLRDQAMHELGVGTTRNMKSVISGIFYPSLRMRDYTPGERVKFWRGKIASTGFAVTKDATGFNAFEEVPKIEIPIYFFAGKYDYTCSYSLQKEYFEAIVAPEKEFYTFEDSAHSPIYEEPEKASEIFEKILSY